MLKNAKIAGEIKPVDPNRGVAEAILEAGRRTDASNKALIDAIKNMSAPQVQVVHHETKQTVMTPIPVPRRRVFTVERDGAGLLERVVANKLTFTVQRDENGSMTQIIVEAKND